MRTFGTATLDGKYWRLEVEPQVALRLKRWFARINQRRARELYLANTDENCRDLEVFLDRYPLKVSPKKALTAGARAFDAKCEKIAEILSGKNQISAAPMALPPREYQRQAATLWLNDGYLLLADELGLGKTVSAIAGLSDPRTRPALVVTMTHLCEQWRRELVRFLPTLRVHVARRGTAYPLANKDGFEPDVVVMNYHKLAGWADSLAGRVQAVVFDECQELRHDETSKYRAARMIAEAAPFRLGLSATPIYNYGAEFYTVLSILAQDALGTREEFDREWLGEAGENLKDPRAFGAYLRESGLMLKRTRADVGRELPALTKIIHEVAIDEAPLEEIKNNAAALATFIVSAEGRGIDRLQASQNFSMVLRQQTGIAKAPYVAQFVRMLLEETNEPVVLFGWHRAVYKIWKDRLKDFSTDLYTGTETAKEKQAAVDRFRYGQTRVLMVSLRSGAGLDGLQSVCCRAVIGELDWSPGVLEQCVGRVHRDGQQNPVMAYYLIANDGADPVMVDVLGLKRSQVEGVINPDGGTEVHEVDPNHVKKLAADYLKRLGHPRAIEVAA
ncbi:MAG TPA: DEAD/DEAH box helicase [Candidatus Binatia bacterium]|nr:DEAD/DEAH box helicase [Candidatus Binatia bacterium]